MLAIHPGPATLIAIVPGYIHPPDPELQSRREQAMLALEGLLLPFASNRLGARLRDDFLRLLVPSQQSMAIAGAPPQVTVTFTLPVRERDDENYQQALSTLLGEIYVRMQEAEHEMPAMVVYIVFDDGGPHVGVGIFNGLMSIV